MRWDRLFPSDSAREYRAGSPDGRGCGPRAGEPMKRLVVDFAKDRILWIMLALPLGANLMMGILISRHLQSHRPGHDLLWLSAFLFFGIGPLLAIFFRKKRKPRSERKGRSLRVIRPDGSSRPWRRPR